MASQKQIAANRANAQRSTGPKTAMGKMKSSRNAYRHGLSWSSPCNVATASEVDAIARVLTSQDAGELERTSAVEFASAHIQLLRISEVRRRLWQEVDLTSLNTHKLRRLASLDRYERYADTRRRRAASKF
jgi:hypothetical protein